MVRPQYSNFDCHLLVGKFDILSIFFPTLQCEGCQSVRQTDMVRPQSPLMNNLRSHVNTSQFLIRFSSKSYLHFNTFNQRIEIKRQTSTQPEVFFLESEGLLFQLIICNVQKVLTPYRHRICPLYQYIIQKQTHPMIIKIDTI